MDYAVERIDLPSTVRKVHYFFIVDGGLFLEVFYLVQTSILLPYKYVLAIPVILAALLNLLFLGVFETSLRKVRHLSDAEVVTRCRSIPEKVALLDLWVQLGRLRFGVFLATILVNILSLAYLYHCLTV